MKNVAAEFTWWTFLRGALRSPRSVGAIVPSSPWLVAALVDAARIEQAQTVVEFGSGTGAVTNEILRRLRPRARLVAFEVDTHFATQLRLKVTDSRATILNTCATDAPRHLRELGMHSADCVVSSLPLTSLPRPLTHQVLKAATALLRPGGMFVTYQFTNAARSVLEHHFPQAQVSRLVLRNLPPAMVFICPKPVVAYPRPAVHPPQLVAPL
ncbi:MAG: rRNA adenine N-6-methyltransferase family protein [Verrucomicrobiota bacterium]